MYRVGRRGTKCTKPTSGHGINKSPLHICRTTVYISHIWERDSSLTGLTCHGVHVCTAGFFRQAQDALQAKQHRGLGTSPKNVQYLYLAKYSHRNACAMLRTQNTTAHIMEKNDADPSTTVSSTRGKWATEVSSCMATHAVGHDDDLPRQTAKHLVHVKLFGSYFS